MAKYGQDPDLAARIVRRRANARRVRDKVQAATGRSLEAILDETRTDEEKSP